jgi:hypothetical protein
VKVGLILETRYSVNPDDAELKAFGIERACQCITSTATALTRPGEALMLDGATVISQLTNALTIQNEYLGDAKVINRRNQVLVEEQEEKKKDRLKSKLHLSIQTMLQGPQRRTPTTKTVISLPPAFASSIQTMRN